MAGSPTDPRLERDSFRIRPSARKPHGERPAHRVTSSFLRIIRGIRTPGRARRESAAPPAAATAFQQRCAIRFTYAANRRRGHFAAHGRYLMRDSALGGSLPYGTLGAATVPELLARWQQASDRRLFKMIVSPEFGERANLTELANGLMEAVQRDLNRQFEWVAVNHYNTDHPHVHIAIRGVDADGTEFRFPRDYVKSEMRRHAQRLCTEQMGTRTREDVRLGLSREVEQFRWTSIDRAMWKQAEIGVDGQRSVTPRTEWQQARLQFLSRAGLATPFPMRGWSLPGDLDEVLKQMALASDRQRVLARGPFPALSCRTSSPPRSGPLTRYDL